MSVLLAVPTRVPVDVPRNGRGVYAAVSVGQNPTNYYVPQPESPVLGSLPSPTLTADVKLPVGVVAGATGAAGPAAASAAGAGAGAAGAVGAAAGASAVSPTATRQRIMRQLSDGRLTPDTAACAGSLWSAIKREESDIDALRTELAEIRSKQQAFEADFMFVSALSDLLKWIDKEYASQPLQDSLKKYNKLVTTLKDIEAKQAKDAKLAEAEAESPATRRIQAEAEAKKTELTTIASEMGLNDFQILCDLHGLKEERNAGRHFTLQGKDADNRAKFLYLSYALERLALAQSNALPAGSNMAVWVDAKWSTVDGLATWLKSKFEGMNMYDLLHDKFESVSASELLSPTAVERAVALLLPLVNATKAVAAKDAAAAAVPAPTFTNRADQLKAAIATSKDPKTRATLNVELRALMRDEAARAAAARAAAAKAAAARAAAAAAKAVKPAGK